MPLVPEHTIYRPAVSELEIRSAAQGGDGRTVYGYAVPFDKPTVIDDRLTEEFDRSAFNHQFAAIHRVPLFHGHEIHGGKHVGHLTMARADAAGLYTEGRASKTRDGDDFLEMVRDGSLPHWSVGFTVPATGSQVRGKITRRVRANLTELAGVHSGAYGEDAPIAGVRSGLAVAGVCPTCGHREAVASGHRDVSRILATLPILPSPA